MGSNMKPTIFNERVATALRKWHHMAKKHIKENRGSVTPMSSRPTTPSHHHMSPVHLLRHYRGEMDSLQVSPRRTNFEVDHSETDSPSSSRPNYGEGSSSHRHNRMESGNVERERGANEPSSSNEQGAAEQHEIDMRSLEFSFDKRQSK
ncbi:hypothetical protein SLEP1_g7180 [Rubroshorea leprosula]|uniref:MLO-like protein 6 n=1 Tax=Rubroshorea leprosula TaxID=152421 RepID=A0AAV5I5V3_9ROSI|nr:hypothetical protein SLEP1_g7180 [Rubroshorea leprosula]